MRSFPDSIDENRSIAKHHPYIAYRPYICGDITGDNQHVRPLSTLQGTNF